jgi:hypothetical protein
LRGFNGYEGISHKDVILCPHCGGEIAFVKKIVLDKVKDILRKAVERGNGTEGNK